jgi:hypothetical protein
MSPVEVLSMAASLSLLAGWRLYACILGAGIAMRLGLLPLPEHIQSLQVLANPWVMGLAAFGFLASSWPTRCHGSTVPGTLSTR